MRPQDIAILLKIVALNGQHWQLSGLSNALRISVSEISESLNRSQFAGLIDHNKKNINKQNLLEFLVHGVRYVFPQQPGAMLRGVPTAHSHQFMKNSFISEINFVWPTNIGDTLGLSIEPFYPKQPDGAIEDQKYYLLLALVDVIRVGKVREVKHAALELKKVILDESSY
jgi:hypothetical protein